MNRQQARAFAIGVTALTTLAFIGLTIHSHTRFDALTRAENITPEVSRGKEVWHKYNCVNCHTLFGEGAYYAPDLTKITQHRGTAYLTAFMKNPAQFYSEEKYRRVMPDMGLSDAEIADVLAFLDWISRVDNQGWPPRPILVSGSATPAADSGAPATAQAASSDPIALGEALFRASPPGCFGCHSVAAGVQLAGPSLAGMAQVAQRTLASPSYRGNAKTVEEYIRESIVAPSAHLVPGAQYSANGQSFMPSGFQQDLSAAQIDQLVSYLMTLKE